MLKFGLILSILMSATIASAATPRIDVRQARQEARIEQGAISGRLSQRELATLNRQQDRIARAERRFESDGVVTRQERARLHHRLNASSRTISHAKRHRW